MARVARRHRQVAQGERCGIGGIGGLRHLAQAEAGLHHPLDLLLGCRAPSGDGALDLVRGVLHDVAPGVGGLGEGEPAGLAHAHRRAHVDLEEHLLDGDDAGRVLGDEAGELATQHGQAPRQRTVARRADHAEGDGDAGRRARGVDDGVPAAGETGVDPEHAVPVVGEHRFVL